MKEGPYSGWQLRTVLTVAMILSCGASALAQSGSVPAPIWTAQAAAPAGEMLTFALGEEDALVDPFFAGQALYLRPFQGPLANQEKAGVAWWDRHTSSWYGAANGTLVRVKEDGRLVVVGDNVQGRDGDVRSDLGRLVTREPDNTIVLHRFGASRQGRKVLLKGEQYFHPRLSPDGRTVLVAASHKGAGRMVLVNSREEVTDLGQGYGAAWHPHGKRIVFARIVHDSRRILSSRLWLMEADSQKMSPVSLPKQMIPVEPAFSDDGRWLAFVDLNAHRMVVLATEKLLEEAEHESL